VVRDGGGGLQLNGNRIGEGRRQFSPQGREEKVKTGKASERGRGVEGDKKSVGTTKEKREGEPSTKKIVKDG